jgi:formylglycine-generating enzyme required for sulfatase activity
MTLRLIPAGVFVMGSPDTDEDALDGEKPRHKVRMAKPFYLGVTEVTVGQFRRFVEDARYRTEAERDGQGGYGWDEAIASFVMGPKYTWRSPGFPQGDDHPVVLVSWNDAMEFLAWLGRKEGRTYRLPTEAEWEYACRAGTTTKYCVGDDPEALATVGNVADGTAREKFPAWKTMTIKARDGYVYTSPAGRFRANAFGLLDMHGNVWEWCSDWYDSKYYKTLPSLSEDPGGPPGPAADRVVRGGSWGSLPRNARSAYRGSYAPGYRSGFLGFRAARVQ